MSGETVAWALAALAWAAAITTAYLLRRARRQRREEPRRVQLPGRSGFLIAEPEPGSFGETVWRAHTAGRTYLDATTTGTAADVHAAILRIQTDGHRLAEELHGREQRGKVGKPPGDTTE